MRIAVGRQNGIAVRMVSGRFWGDPLAAYGDWKRRFDAAEGGGIPALSSLS